LKDRVGGDGQLVRVKVDPGSKTTGIAVITEERLLHQAYGTPFSTRLLHAHQVRSRR
jgi:hypothetical protein